MTLNDAADVTVDGSRQLFTPHSREIYQILEVYKDGFSLKLKNLISLAEGTVVHSRVDFLDAEDFNHFELGS